MGTKQETTVITTGAISLPISHIYVRNFINTTQYWYVKEISYVVGPVHCNFISDIYQDETHAKQFELQKHQNKQGILWIAKEFSTGLNQMV
jgi:hypothetical protein